VVDDPSVIITTESWRGVRTLELSMTRVRHSGQGWYVTTAFDPFGISGFRFLADKLCDQG
jgi:hypothetical protein